MTMCRRNFQSHIIIQNESQLSVSSHHCSQFIVSEWAWSMKTNDTIVNDSDDANYSFFKNSNQTIENAKNFDSNWLYDWVHIIPLSTYFPSPHLIVFVVCTMYVFVCLFLLFSISRKNGLWWQSVQVQSAREQHFGVIKKSFAKLNNNNDNKDKFVRPKLDEKKNGKKWKNETASTELNRTFSTIIRVQDIVERDVHDFISVVLDCWHAFSVLFSFRFFFSSFLLFWKICDSVCTYVR